MSVRRTRIKFCGITNVDDALAAVNAGADALGFVFAQESPRVIEPQTVAEIGRALPPFVAKVGLFVNAGLETINRVVDVSGIDTVQLHGNEAIELCHQIRLPVIKAIRVGDPAAPGSLANQIKAYRGLGAVLFDSFDQRQAGGTGRVFDWSEIPERAASDPCFILAGGLRPENVGEAIRQVRPFAVDVSGGIEYAKGRKDHQKMNQFVKEVNNVVNE